MPLTAAIAGVNLDKTSAWLHAFVISYMMCL